jgi:hypothetical protein
VKALIVETLRECLCLVQFIYTSGGSCMGMAAQLYIA